MKQPSSRRWLLIVGAPGFLRHPTSISAMQLLIICIQINHIFHPQVMSFSFEDKRSAKEKVSRSLATTGLSLRAGGRGFSPATTSLSPGYSDTERKYWKEKNVSNYKIMN